MSEYIELSEAEKAANRAAADAERARIQHYMDIGIKSTRNRRIAAWAVIVGLGVVIHVFGLMGVIEDSISAERWMFFVVATIGIMTGIIWILRQGTL